jgi:phosphopantothenoylcysteine synthetase/decarboxylase
MINILIVLFSFLHPFYVSVTDINHNSKNKSLEISSKIFFDDLEREIEMENKVSFDIIKPVDKAKVNALIADYVKKHLQIKVDGKLLTMNYIGYEIQEDAAWCYLEIPKVDKVGIIEINDHILFKLHTEQINMLNVTVNGKRQSTKLDAPTSRVNFKF